MTPLYAAVLCCVVLRLTPILVLSFSHFFFFFFSFFYAVQNDAADATYQIRLSLLEIYNEKMNDLVDTKSAAPLKIVRGDDGTYVQNLSLHEVTSYEQVLSIMKAGAGNRSVEKTDMNARSSRSHLVLSIYVECVNRTLSRRTVSKLHLIDLAGSERVSRSNVQGDRLKEAQNINKSLSALGLCISARVNKQAHVPYRNSVLTYFLQDSLEKNSKTLMIVQASPTMADAAETVNSLRFAEHARKVEMGKAKKNVTSPR